LPQELVILELQLWAAEGEYVPPGQMQLRKSLQALSTPLSAEPQLFCSQEKHAELPPCDERHELLLPPPPPLLLEHANSAIAVATEAPNAHVFFADPIGSPSPRDGFDEEAHTPDIGYVKREARTMVISVA
jgi:hypothetical protein